MYPAAAVIAAITTAITASAITTAAEPSTTTLPATNAASSEPAGRVRCGHRHVRRLLPTASTNLTMRREPPLELCLPKHLQHAALHRGLPVNLHPGL